MNTISFNNALLRPINEENDQIKIHTLVSCPSILVRALPVIKDAGTEKVIEKFATSIFV
jgi:hypothetical protein